MTMSRRCQQNHWEERERMLSFYLQKKMLRILVILIVIREEA